MLSKQELQPNSDIPKEQIMFKEIHHIGIVVRDIEKTAKYLTEKLGMSFTIRTIDHSG